MSPLPQFAVVQGVAHTALVVVSCPVLPNQGGVAGSLVFPKLPAHVLHLVLHLEGPWNFGQYLMLAKRRLT